MMDDLRRSFPDAFDEGNIETEESSQTTGSRQSKSGLHRNKLSNPNSSSVTAQISIAGSSLAGRTIFDLDPDQVEGEVEEISILSQSHQKSAEPQKRSIASAVIGGAQRVWKKSIDKLVSPQKAAVRKLQASTQIIPGAALRQLQTAMPPSTRHTGPVPGSRPLNPLAGPYGTVPANKMYAQGSAQQTRRNANERNTQPSFMQKKDMASFSRIKKGESSNKGNGHSELQGDNNNANHFKLGQPEAGPSNLTPWGISDRPKQPASSTQSRPWSARNNREDESKTTDLLENPPPTRRGATKNTKRKKGKQKAQDIRPAAETEPQQQQILLLTDSDDDGVDAEDEDPIENSQDSDIAHIPKGNTQAKASAFDALAEFGAEDEPMQKAKRVPNMQAKGVPHLNIKGQAARKAKSEPYLASHPADPAIEFSNRVHRFGTGAGLIVRLKIKKLYMGRTPEGSSKGYFEDGDLFCYPGKITFMHEKISHPYDFPIGSIKRLVRNDCNAKIPFVWLQVYHQQTYVGMTSKHFDGTQSDARDKALVRIYPAQDDRKSLEEFQAYLGRLQKQDDKACEFIPQAAHRALTQQMDRDALKDRDPQDLIPEQDITQNRRNTRSKDQLIEGGPSKTGKDPQKPKKGRTSNHSEKGQPGVKDLFEAANEKELNSPKGTRRSDRGKGRPSGASLPINLDDDDEDERPVPADSKGKGKAKAPKLQIHKPPDAPLDEIILIYPFDGVGGVSITWNDVFRLEEEEFLNDTLIEFGLKLLMADLKAQDETIADRVHIFNSFFYKKLTTKLARNKMPTDEAYDSVSKWTAKFDLFQKDYIVVPINENLHWYLAIISKPRYYLEPHARKLPKYARQSSQPARKSARVSVASVSASNVSTQGDDIEMGGPSEAGPSKRQSLSRNDDLDTASMASAEPDDGPTVERWKHFEQNHLTPQKPRNSMDFDVDAHGEMGESGLEGTLDLSQLQGNFASNMASLSSQNNNARKLARTISSSSLSSGNSVRNGIAPQIQETHISSETDARARCNVLTFDSLGSLHTPVVKALNFYLSKEAVHKNKATAESIALADAYGMEVKVPQQSNFCDCGLFLLHFVKRFLQDPDNTMYQTQHWPKVRSEAKKKKKLDWADATLTDMREFLKATIMALSAEWKVIRKEVEAREKQARLERRRVKLEAERVLANGSHGAAVPDAEAKVPISEPQQAQNPEAIDPGLLAGPEAAALEGKTTSITEGKADQPAEGQPELPQPLSDPTAIFDSPAHSPGSQVEQTAKHDEQGIDTDIMDFEEDVGATRSHSPFSVKMNLGPPTSKPSSNSSGKGKDRAFDGLSNEYMQDFLDPAAEQSSTQSKKRKRHALEVPPPNLIQSAHFELGHEHDHYGQPDHLFPPALRDLPTAQETFALLTQNIITPPEATRTDYIDDDVPFVALPDPGQATSQGRHTRWLDETDDTQADLHRPLKRGRRDSIQSGISWPSVQKTEEGKGGLASVIPAEPFSLHTQEDAASHVSDSESEREQADKQSSSAAKPRNKSVVYGSPAGSVWSQQIRGITPPRQEALGPLLHVRPSLSPGKSPKQPKSDLKRSPYFDNQILPHQPRSPVDLAKPRSRQSQIGSPQVSPHNSRHIRFPSDQAGSSGNNAIVVD